MALALLAPTGLATAQVNLRGAQASGGLPTASAATSSSRTGAQGVLASEPKSMAGMLAAQNDARGRLNLAPLSWSAELTTRAEETAREGSLGSCSRFTAETAGAKDDASVFWAPPIRRLDGAGMVQDILPSFLVSEWKTGRADYDAARGECRKSGACEQYSRMIAPSARSVGCAKSVCDSHGQVWACLYSSGEAASPPDLRRRQGD